MHFSSDKVQSSSISQSDLSVIESSDPPNTPIPSLVPDPLPSRELTDREESKVQYTFE